MSAPTGIARLEAFEDLRQLKARYFRLLDTKDFEAFRDVFTEDFRYLDDAKDLAIEGRDAWVDFIVQRHTDSVSVHVGHDPELTLDSDTEAHGIWGMLDYVILPLANGRRVQTGAGHYRERYRKVDGQWRIAETHLSRLWLSVDQQERNFADVTARA